MAAESGQVLLLGIGLVAFVLAFILVVASVTAVYLDLKRLTALADSAAAAGAQAVDLQQYYGQASTAASTTVLTNAGVAALVRRDVQAQVAHLQASSLTQVRVAQAEVLGADTVVVTLQAHSQPAFLPWGIIPAQGFALTASSSAKIATMP